jgi:hypothetical protein
MMRRGRTSRAKSHRIEVEIMRETRWVRSVAGDADTADEVKDEIGTLRAAGVNVVLLEDVLCHLEELVDELFADVIAERIG